MKIYIKISLITILFFFTQQIFANHLIASKLCKKAHGTYYVSEIELCRAGTYALKLNGIPKEELALRIDTRSICILIDDTDLNTMTASSEGRWFPVSITCFDGTNDPMIPYQQIFIPNDSVHGKNSY